MPRPTISGSCLRALSRADRRLVAVVVLLGGGLEVRAAEPAGPVKPTRQRMVDPAVVPAGGMNCTTCGPAGCRHGHLPGCRDGACVAYCPVRPQQYGYYGTRWRKWPGQDVVPVSGERAVAPVNPPRSEVPAADEESMSRESGGGESAMAPAPAEPARVPDRPRPPAAEFEPAPPVTRPRPPAPPADAVPEPATEPNSEPNTEPTEPAVPTEPPSRAEPPAAPPVEPEPQVEPPPEPEPELKPEPKSPPKVEPPRGEDENLFEVLSGSGWRAKRKFAVGAGGGQTDDVRGTTATGIRPTTHAEPVGPRDVPRVPFDPKAETRRVRAVR